MHYICFSRKFEGRYKWKKIEISIKKMHYVCFSRKFEGRYKWKKIEKKSKKKTKAKKNIFLINFNYI